MAQLEVFQNEPTDFVGGDYLNANDAGVGKPESSRDRSNSSGEKDGNGGKRKKKKKKKGSGSGSDNKSKSKKKGALFMGCCCDMRRACIILNIVNMFLMVLLDILVINIIGIPQVIALMVVVTLISCTFSCIGILGALRYNTHMVIAAAVWYCIAILINLYNKDLISAIVSGIFAYAHIVFTKELKAGIMTKENYNKNEIYSCCCV